MQFGLLSLLFKYPPYLAVPLIIMIVISLVLTISIHEFSHAKVADLLGDNTARLLGRVTLNPKAHLDPLGSIFIFFLGFGWGKPVPFNPINLHNPKRDSAIIALAGPCSNFLLAGLFSIFVRFFAINSFVGDFLYLVIYFNILLGVFNLIPVHPLDGFKVVGGILPPSLYIQWMQFAPYGIYFLLILIVTGATDVVVRPLISFLLNLLGL